MLRRPLFFRSLAILGLWLAVAAPATAQGLDRYDATLSTQASVTYGPYLRLELGGQMPDLADAYWRPPGWVPNPPPGDPQVNFDLSGDTGGLAAIAVGFDWQNGIRGDLSFLATRSSGFSGPCSSASDGSSCAIHATIADGSVQTRALMANLFYAPLEARGANSRFQPFVVAGLGFARNEVESWTRVNPLSATQTRVFGSHTENAFAWSLGLGASWQLTDPGERPVLLEVAWRYYDFGEAVGSGIGTPGGPGSVPVQPLTFDLTSQVFSIGLRIPLQRY